MEPRVSLLFLIWFLKLNNLISIPRVLVFFLLLIAHESFFLVLLDILKVKNIFLRPSSIHSVNNLL